MARPDRHPREPELRALLDRELGPLDSLRAKFHVRGCPRCRGKLAQLNEVASRSAWLLARVEPAIDAAGGWRRLQVLSGGLAGRRPRPALRSAAWIGGAAVMVFGLVVLLRPGPEPRASAPAAEAAAQTEAAAVRDLCCWDLDGGGPGDDGVLTVTVPGERVVTATVYEDANGSGDISFGDPLRSGTLRALPAAGYEASAGSRGAAPGGERVVRDFCCADYDGGGPADDGILTISEGGERVERVLVYEDEDDSRSFTAGDIVRLNSGIAWDSWVGLPAELDAPDS